MKVRFGALPKIIGFPLFVVCLTALVTAWCSAAYAESPGANPVVGPKQDMKQTLDELVQVVEAYPGDDVLEKRRKVLREKIEPRFDFDEMAKRSLGSHWQKRTESERQKFVEVFSELLARTYLSRIEMVRANMVEIKNESVDFPKATVKTLVTYKGETFPIDYKLLSTNGVWKVYDVVIENIGLVANYRNEFAGIIRKEGFEGLMKVLNEKKDKVTKEVKAT